jgi:dGTPase
MTTVPVLSRELPPSGRAPVALGATLPVGLASYAVSQNNTRGRRHDVDLSHDRTPFQRDYTRILHSTAFRRLQGKTQVFSAVEGDMFRTRMSHSMEVEQVARSIARQLNLNEDLCGTLAIGHDIGHPPFGHMGQDILNELLQEHGGFEHNYQALRLVDQIESPYIEHRGLNLLFEVREGLLKHCSPERAKRLGPVAQRHFDGTSPPLEVQATDWADAIAYVHADLEDAFAKGLLSIDQIKAAPGFPQAWARVKANPRYPGLAFPTAADFERDAGADVQQRAHAIVRTVIRDMMSFAVNDVVQATRARLEARQIRTLDDVRQAPELVGFSPKQEALHKALKKFSRTHIYEHPHIVEVRTEQSKALVALFNAYVRAPEEMSGRGPDPKEEFYRSIADHIAGMTDGYALSEHRRLLACRPELFMTVEPVAAPACPSPRRAAPRLGR